MNQSNLERLRGRRSLHEVATAGIRPTRPPHVSIYGSRFTLVNAAGDGQTWPQLWLPIVVVDVSATLSRSYWSGGFDPNNPMPPDCFSDNGVAASYLAQEVQAPSCAECEFSKWGSDFNEQTQTRRMACNEKKKLAVLVPGDGTGLCYEFQVPGGSLRNWDRYVDMIKQKPSPLQDGRCELDHIVTVVMFEEGKNQILTFRPGVALSHVTPQYTVDWNHNSPDGGEWFAGCVIQVEDSGVTRKLIGADDKPFSGYTPRFQRVQNEKRPQLQHQPETEPVFDQGQFNQRSQETFSPGQSFGPGQGATPMQQEPAMQPQTGRGRGRGGGRARRTQHGAPAATGGPGFVQGGGGFGQQGSAPPQGGDAFGAQNQPQGDPQGGDGFSRQNQPQGGQQGIPQGGGGFDALPQSGGNAPAPGGDPNPMSGFLDRRGPGNTFGVQANPAPTDPQMSNMLNSAFQLPTGQSS